MSEITNTIPVITEVPGLSDSESPGTPQHETSEALRHEQSELESLRTLMPVLGLGSRCLHRPASTQKRSSLGGS